MPSWPFAKEEVASFPVENLGRKIDKKGSQAITKILVQWSNLSVADATWEEYVAIKAHFPQHIDL